MTLGHRIAVLDQGHLQQVAPPRELYDHPANLFVAGFIGTPPMNLFPVAFGVDASSLHLALAEQRLRLDAPLRARTLAASAARVRHAGARPEAFSLVSDGTVRDVLSGTVVHVEFLGHETLLHVAIGDLRLVVRLPGMQSLANGDALRLTIDPAQLHLFDEAGNAQ
jgi:ABC-type sugar transport system ATPase subunit